MTQPRPNRGPRASEENYRALLSAAREVFAEAGIDAPRSAVARRAGVGQGSLYRHFPDRISLALAVFEDNVVALEALAADPRTTLDDLLALLTDMTIESVGFVDILTAEPDDPRVVAATERVRTVLAEAVRTARDGGRFRRTVTVDDVLLAVAMVAATIARTPAPSRRPAADRAWTLLREAFRAPP